MELSRLANRTALALAAALALVAIPARAEPVGLEPLRIELDAKASRKPPTNKKALAKYQKDWKTACDKLGKALMAQSGPYGFGAFASYSCYRGGKNVGGPDKPTKWTLTVVDGVKDFTFSLAHQGPSGKTEVSDLKLAGDPSALQFFQDDEFTDMVAYGLLESLPMGMLVSKAKVKGNPPTFTGRYWRAGLSPKFKYKIPEAPETLMLYRLSFDDATGTWKSTVVGNATRKKVVQPKKKKVKKATLLVGGEVVYETTPAVAEELNKGPLWAQDGNGPGAQKTVIQADANQANEELGEAADDGRLQDFIRGKGPGVISALLSTAGADYVGFRLGKELLPGEGQLGTLINKTIMFGLLVEIRGGPLKGLRYYYDLIPKVSVTLNGTNGPVTADMASSRHTLGFSWDFPIGFIVDRVTVDPKLGLWSYNADLPAALDENGNVAQMASFNLGKTFSLALEVGAEEEGSWWLLREWYGINVGYSLLKTGGKVTSNRFGVDASFTAGPKFDLFGVPFKTAILAFYVYESVTLTSGKNPNPAPGEQAISGVTYNAGYVGAGAAISW